MSSFEPAVEEGESVDVPVSAVSEPAAEPVAQQLAPVAAALAELDRLPDLELVEHPDAYQRIHVELQAALAAIDDA